MAGTAVYHVGRNAVSQLKNASASKPEVQTTLEPAASALITMKAQGQGGAVRSTMEYSLLVRLENAVVAYARYIGKTFWPWPLSPMYPHPGNSLPTWSVVASSVLLVAVTALVLVQQGRHSEAKALVSQKLQRWKADTDLAGIRDETTVKALADDEQKACRELWAEVDALLAKSQGGTASRPHR